MLLTGDLWLPVFSFYFLCYTLCSMIAEDFMEVFLYFLSVCVSGLLVLFSYLVFYKIGLDILTDYCFIYVFRLFGQDLHKKAYIHTVVYFFLLIFVSASFFGIYLLFGSLFYYLFSSYSFTQLVLFGCLISCWEVVLRFSYFHWKRFSIFYGLSVAFGFFLPEFLVTYFFSSSFPFLLFWS